MHVAPHVARLTPRAAVDRGVGRCDLRRRAALPRPRTRGSGWPCCARRCPTSRCRCCCAGATPSATRPTPPRSPTRSCTRPPAPGIDIFRIFDSLNDVARCARRSRRCSTPAPPSPRWRSATPATSLSPAREALHPRLLPAPRRADRRHRRARARHQGHGRPAACAGGDAPWSPRCASDFDQPVHLHTHDTAGGQLGTLLAAIDAGVDAVDAASASMAGTTSQPSRCRPWSPPPTAPTARHRARHRQGRSTTSSPTGRRCASSTRPSSPGLPSPTGRVYFHEIPGGQLSNLRQQAIALGLGDHFEDVEDMYAAANRILGNIVKVTPSSKVVGDLALALVGAEADPADFEANPTKYDIPDSVIGFLVGRAGRPARRLARAVPHQGPRGSHAKPRVTELSDEDRSRARGRARGTPSTGCCSPARRRSSRSPASAYADLGRPRHPRVPARARGRVRARDRPRARQAAAARPPVGVGRRRPAACAPSCSPWAASCGPSRCATSGSRSTSRPPRRPTRPAKGQVRRAVRRASSASPVEEGATVEAGAVVATIEAMKMEANITAPVGRLGRSGWPSVRTSRSRAATSSSCIAQA